MSQPNSTDFRSAETVHRQSVVFGIESTLNQIDHRISMLKDEETQQPVGSPRYIDLDKNISELEIKEEVTQHDLQQLKSLISDSTNVFRWVQSKLDLEVSHLNAFLNEMTPEQTPAGQIIAD